LNWEEFRRISKWATASTEVGDASDKTSWLWKIQTARAIFTVCQSDQDAIEEAKKLIKEVRSLDGRPWEGSVLACKTIANQLDRRSYRDAQKILEAATQKLPSNGKELKSSKSDSLLAAEALLDLGDLYWKGDHHENHRRTDRAAVSYQESLKFDVTRYARYVKILHQYRQEGFHSQIIDLLRDLTSDRDFEKVYLKRLVYDFLAKDEFRRSILSATGQKNWDEVVDMVFKKAIETAKESHVERFHICKAYGEILHQRGNPEREEVVRSCWEDALKYGLPLASTTSDISWPDMFSVIDPLAFIYLHRAVKALVAAKAENKTDTISIEPVKANLDSASHYLDLIEKLEQKTDMWMNTTLICYKARYHTVAGNPKIAKSAVSKVIAASISILSDNDQTNDWFAYLQLWRIMEALQDDQHSEEARKRLESLASPGASPSHRFHCNECENSIHLSEKVHVCLESFGLKYLHKKCYDLKSAELQGGILGMRRFVIISPGTSDSKAVLGSGRSLSDWKAELQEKYVDLCDVVDVSPLTSFIPPQDAPSPDWTPRTPTFPGDPPTFEVNELTLNDR
jgi:tetratricopeptide (TPR) repeat protein